MKNSIILASASSIRRVMLVNAGLDVTVIPARIDENSVKDSLLVEDATPTMIADTLAEYKATRVSVRQPGRLVLGCDQVLSVNEQVMSKPADLDMARAQLMCLRGQSHDLISAAVICIDGQPVWRHVGSARMTMRSLPEAWIDAYLDKAWPSVSHSVGAYKIEEEGIRLFSNIQGDYFTILGLPLLPLMTFLYDRGELTP